MRIYLTTCIFILYCTSCQQNKKTENIISSLPKTEFQHKTIDRVDHSYMYVNDSSSTELFYEYLFPQEKVKGCLILFPPTAQTVDQAITNNSTLAKLLSNAGIVFVIPSLNFNLYLDETSLSFINLVTEDLIKQLKLPEDRFILGGFSLGGMNAIRYTEMAYENDSLTTIKPIAVYGIDPPLDFERLYSAFERTVERNFSKPAVQEAEMYLQKVNQQFGGPPIEQRERYVSHSMYSHSEPDGGNAKYLKTVPVRIYSDPDIEWNLTQRQNDLYGMNALDQTAMINQLQLTGNQNAEYINALGKGYRLNGNRHPHSWNIAEPTELVEWMEKILVK